MLKDLDNVLNSIYNFGGMFAVDNFPPFIVRFDWFPDDFTEDFFAEYDFAGYPGARHQFPIFKNVSPKTITFTARYDISHRNKNTRNMDLNSFATDFTDVQDIGHEKYFIFKGANKNVVNSMQLANGDYISVIRSLYEKMVLPKYGLARAAQTLAGKLIAVSQGATDPSPPLVLLVKNINKMYLGYLAEAKPKELNHNSRNFCTRIEFACKYLVTPDLIFDSMDEVSRELNIINSFSLMI